MMLTVPLIIEKIYFNKIMPAFRDNMILKLLYNIPFFRKKLNAAAGKKLFKTFGGNLSFSVSEEPNSINQLRNS